MVYDPGLARVLREDLSHENITETKMFGGIAFLLNGHMVCGIHNGDAMFRIGKEGYDEALTIQGVTPVMMGERVMAGMVGLSDEASADDARRGRLMGMALAVVRALPPKMAKPGKG